MLFLIDTLRADRIGAYGYHKHETSPAIDALARDGVVFEQAYGPAPWTAPSVASIFTSTFACEHSHVLFRSGLSDHFETLAQRLVKARIMTYGLSANAFISADFGLSRGFVGFAGAPQIDGEKLDKVFSVRYITPFFFYIHNVEPHGPYHYAPDETPGFPKVSAEEREKIRAAYAEYKAALEADKVDNLPTWSDAHDTRVAAATREMDAHRENYSALYDACVRLADGNVASAIEELKKRGAWDKTIFIVVSDHGEEMGEHGGWLHGQSVYEEQTRVPFVVRFPHNEFAGTRIKPPVSLIDLAPTILDWVGTPQATQGMRGQSLAPLLHGQLRSPDEPQLVCVRRNMIEYYGVWHTQRGEINLAARLGKWKAIWNVEPQVLELYDLEADPGETRNVASATPAVAEKLKRFLITSYEQCQARAAPLHTVQLKSETERNLKANGYLE